MDMTWTWNGHGHDMAWHDMACMTWHAWHDMTSHAITWHDMDMTCHHMTWHGHDMTWTWHDMHDMTWHDIALFFPAWTPSSWRDPWHGIACRPPHPSRKSEFDFAPVWSDRCEIQPRISFSALMHHNLDQSPSLAKLCGQSRESYGVPAWSLRDPKVIRWIFRWSGQMECAKTWRKSVIPIGEPLPFIILKPFILKERERAPGWRAPGHKD